MRAEHSGHGGEHQGGTGKVRLGQRSTNLLSGVVYRDLCEAPLLGVKNGLER